MDLPNATVKGSRHPFTFAVPPPPRPTDQAAMVLIDTHGSQAQSVSRIRRKQLRTFQSPSAQAAAELHIESEWPLDVGHDCSSRYNSILTLASAKDATNAVKSATSDTSSSSSTPSTTTDPYAHINTKHVQKKGPALSLYHPRGRLALALPELDPSLFGLPGSVNIEDHDVRVHVTLQDADDSRRSSSRARRPAAKLREVVGPSAGVGEEEEAHDVSSALNGRKTQTADVQGQTRPASPRKRRSGGLAQAGGGGKRRRKEVDDGDGTYPNPVGRRTRIPRGTAAAAAVASPLTGPAVVAETGPDEHDGEADGDGEDANAQGEIAEAHIARSTRSRRSRVPAPKRRNSSASETTTTSVSISIAANARNARSIATKPQPDVDVAANMEMALPSEPIEDKLNDATSAKQASVTPEVDGTRAEAPKDDSTRSPPADVSMDTEPMQHMEMEASAIVEAAPEVALQENKPAAVELNAPGTGSALDQKSQSSIRNEPPAQTPPKSDDTKMDVDVAVPQNDDPPAAVQLTAKQPEPLATKLSTPPKPVSVVTRHEPPSRPPPPVISSRMRIEDDEKEEGELSEE